MTSRRPMTRSFSGNGRSSSFSEEEGNSSNGRTESRNPYLSNVRPENSYSRYSHYRPTRSTFCSVMAQLTEDVQPSFETTLKSKAVSENCNVKFSCVVTGYPAPELKWYKDDVELDRYCGLPKYEIHRHGKNHTLHIYNCTLDDAAIYQVSASNSKGIVSCSGVLEVGTMNEFKIHQRFFDKLKQKAEKKKRELDEHTKKGDKEKNHKEKQRSPERPQRKRHVPPPEERPGVKGPEEHPGAAAETNGVSNEVTEKKPLTSKDMKKEVTPSEETLAKKKMKITNGVDATLDSSNSSRSNSKGNIMGNGGENSYDGGIGLAQFLAETLQSQAAEEKQNSSQGETPNEMDMPIGNISQENDREQERMQRVREEQEKAVEKEHEREKRREEELVTEREKERERLSHTLPHTKHDSEVKRHSKAHKDHDHHNIQASISSVLHSVKDFFFGKGKKDSHGHTENKEKHSPASTPPSFRLQQEHYKVCKPVVEDIVPMEIDKSKEASETVDIEQQSVSPELNGHEDGDRPQHTDLLPAHKFPSGSTEESTGQSVKVPGGAVEAMEVFVGPESSSPSEAMSLSELQAVTEAEEEDSQTVSVISEVPVLQQETDNLVVSLQPDQQAARQQSSPKEEMSVMLQSEEECFPTSTHTVLEESWTSPNVLISMSKSLRKASIENLQEEKMNVDKLNKLEGEHETEEDSSSNKLCEEEKAEVKSNKHPCSDIITSEMTELTTCSMEEGTEPCQSKTPDLVLLPVPAVAADSVESDHVKEQTECISLIQEMHEFPPTVAPESLETGDLKIQQECSSSIGEEITEVHSVNVIHSSNTGFRSSEEGHVNSCNHLETQEKVILEDESTETSNQSLEFEEELEKVNPVKVGELDETKSFSDGACVLEEFRNVVHEEISTRQQGQPLVNIPEIQISTIEDTPDYELTVTGVSQNEHFISHESEIMEPELKECTLPLTILEQDKQESTFQNHDAAQMFEVMFKDQNVADSPNLLPTQENMQDFQNLPPTEKVKEVAQLDSKVFEQEQPCLKSSEQLPLMDYPSIPVINVSYTEEKEDDVCVDTHVADTQQPVETPAVPLFVVPPISVTCHESDFGLSLPTQSEWTETETSAAMPKGTKPDPDTIITTSSETAQRKRNQEENTPTMLYEAIIPRVSDNVSPFSKTAEENSIPDILKTTPLKEAKIETFVSVEDVQRNRSSVDRLCSKPPAHPALSPASLRKFMSKAAADSEAVTAGDRADEDLSGGSTPTSSLSCESSPRLKRRDSLSLIRSATPEELASGARRKIFIPKTKEEGEGILVGVLDTQGKKETPYISPSQARRAALLQAPTGQNTPPMERRSPLLSRKKVTLEVPKLLEESPPEEPVRQEEKPAEKKLNPLKAPQVIRKIRGEPFPDASGHLKLWCQFFNVLSDSTIKWYRDEEEILEVKRSGGDESQVALAVVLASSQDCGVYGCSITNEYGTDTTDFLLSVDVLSEILLKDDLEVGEEIEMTPLVFNKGLADCGNWGEKYFGRIMTETVHIGEGYAHKASRVKVIYGLDPIFESGSACIIKVQNPIAYGTTQESNLTERNLQITKQECKVQNMIREYCKIFAAEARVNESFGFSLEVIPQYLMYRPANSVPYATVEAHLEGVFLKYCMMDPKGRLVTHTVSEVEQKCSTFQHWIHQWTHGNLLVTHLQGVETKMTNVRVVTKSKGYQGLTENGSPEVFEQFLTHHQCNYYCGLLGLRTLKSMDSLQQPTKPKGSRSPLLNRKSSSPQMQRKGHSPQMLRKGHSSPKVTKKLQETEDNKSDSKLKPAETVDVLDTR